MEISEKSRQAMVDFENSWWKVRTDDGLPRYRDGRPFERFVERIAAAAEGLIEPRPEFQAEILRDIEQLEKWMWLRPGMPAVAIPDEWWSAPIGNLALRAKIWATNDELITLSQAAEMSGKSLSTLSRLIDRGGLSAYPDIEEPNPQRRMRVLRSEVDELKK